MQVYRSAYWLACRTAEMEGKPRPKPFPSRDEERQPGQDTWEISGPGGTLLVTGASQDERHRIHERLQKPKQEVGLFGIPTSEPTVYELKGPRGSAEGGRPSRSLLVSGYDAEARALLQSRLNRPQGQTFPRMSQPMMDARLALMMAAQVQSGLALQAVAAQGLEERKNALVSALAGPAADGTVGALG